jgi:predicted protein tyrosine phosphatase
MTSRMNALWNCQNPNQGDYKRVLCLCSAGLLRSPTIAWILGNNGYNTRSAGVHDYALIPVDDVLIHWADIVVCADQEHADMLLQKHKPKTLVVLGIPDYYAFRHPTLIKLVTKALQEHNLIPPDIEGIQHED